MRLIGLLLRGQGPLTRILHRQARDHHESFFEGSPLGRFQEHARELGVDGKAREGPPHVRELTGFVDGVQLREDRIAVGNGLGGRRLHKVEFAHVPEFQSLHAQNHGRQVRADDFRIGVVRAPGPVVFIKKTNADAVGHAAAAARALIGRGLAHGLDQKLLDLVAIAVALDARQARVDHVADARHRDGGFGHVGGQNNAPRPAAFKDPLLLGGREARVKGQDFDRARSVVGSEHRGGFSDFALARQKDEDVAAPVHHQLVAGVGHRVHQRLVVRLVGVVDRPIADLHGVGAPRNRKDGRGFSVEFKVLGKALGVDRGRGDDHLEVLALLQHALEVPEQKVDVDRALVRFVDDDRVVAL